MARTRGVNGTSCSTGIRKTPIDAPVCASSGMSEYGCCMQRILPAAGQLCNYQHFQATPSEKANQTRPKRHRRKPPTNSVVWALARPPSLKTAQREILCAAAGCSLMGLAKNTRETASVPGKTQPLRRKRQHPSAYYPWDHRAPAR